MKKIIMMSLLTMCLATANAQNVTVQNCGDGSQPTVEKGNVYTTVEKMPEFPGGVTALMDYINNNLRYPSDAEEAEMQGRVIVEYVVNKDGSISDAKVTKRVFPSLDEEALRVVKRMPRWRPGEQKGEKVRVKFTLPISFKLQGSKPSRRYGTR